MSNQTPRVIALIGMSGSGKTTVGRLLAQSLGYQFIDTDQLVEAHAGMTVAEIFQSQGEPVFRELEARAVKDAVQGTVPVVVAIAGGALMREATRNAVRENASTVWLVASIDSLVERVTNSTITRPLLQEDPRKKITELTEQRTPIYASVADHQIETDNLSPEAIVDRAIKCVVVSDIQRSPELEF